jgi:hypothetical protein
MVSLLQKVENVTEDLRMKDKLLERAQVQAKEAEERVQQLSRVDSAPTQVYLSELLPAIPQNTHLQFDNYLSPSSPPLPFSSPIGSNNEDIDMHDSEADKLKEGRMHRKALRKGKARQKVQQYEEMGDIDTEFESDDEMLANTEQIKHKAVDVNFDKDEEVVEADAVRLHSEKDPN